jgi:hypothetical protein
VKNKKRGGDKDIINQLSEAHNMRINYVSNTIVRDFISINKKYDSNFIFGYFMACTGYRSQIFAIHRRKKFANIRRDPFYALLYFYSLHYTTQHNTAYRGCEIIFVQKERLRD